MAKVALPAKLPSISVDLACCRDLFQQCKPATAQVYADCRLYEQGRLRTVGLMAGGAEPGEELFVIYVPQLGFMLKMPMPRVLPAEQERSSVS